MRRLGEGDADGRALEDEQHALLHCPRYDTARQQLKADALVAGIHWVLTTHNILAGETQMDDNCDVAEEV
jgi:hypothetical protein